MSTLNIYEKDWINIIFENRNKEYGAYPLRKENTKTSLFALLIGTLLLAALISIPVIYNCLNPKHTISSIVPDIPIVVIDFKAYEIPKEHIKIKEPVLLKIKKPITENNTNEQLINPVIVQSSVITPNIATNIETKNTANSAIDSVGVPGLNSMASTGTNPETSNPIISENTIVKTNALDKLPEFPGGINKFYSYVGNNFEKPDIEIENTIRVNVSFVIEKDGSMTDIKVTKDPGYGLGVEAIRVLKSLRTKWSPGMIAGKAVRVSYNLPIVLQMN